MNVLFLLESPEYLRFFDSAIEGLAARGHAVAIAVTSDRTGKPVGLGGLQQYADRVRVLGMVPQHTGFWGPTTRRCSMTSSSSAGASRGCAARTTTRSSRSS